MRVEILFLRWLIILALIVLGIAYLVSSKGLHRNENETRKPEVGQVSSGSASDG